MNIAKFYVYEMYALRAEIGMWGCLACAQPWSVVSATVPFVAWAVLAGAFLLAQRHFSKKARTA